jgi:hypothetical protein
MWVNEYLLELHGERRGQEIIADIDRRYGFQSSLKRSCLIFFSFHSISAVPAFPGLRRFPDGRDFLQWTGDDLKALMKVCLCRIGLSPSLIMSITPLRYRIGIPRCYRRTCPCCGRHMPVCAFGFLLYRAP